MKKIYKRMPLHVTLLKSLFSFKFTTYLIFLRTTGELLLWNKKLILKSERKYV